MKRIIAIASSVIMMGAAVHAQVNIGALQDGHNSANAAGFLPTYLGDHFQNLQVTVFNPYVSLGSSFATFKDAREYITADKITSEMIGNTISKLDPEDNNINGAVDIALLNVAFNLTNKEGRKTASFGFGVNERAEVNMTFNDDLLALAWKGNKQFAGQTVNILPRFNGLAFTEYYVSTSFNISPANSDVIIKPAIRLSYLSGQASINMPKDNSISLYTEPEGRYLDFGFNYTVNASLDADSVALAGSTFNINNKSFRAGAGSGFGVDLGLRVSPSPGVSFNVGLMDVGSITFKNGVTNMFNHSGYRYEGEELTFTENQSVNLDSLAGLAKPTYTHEAYTVRLPTKLILTGSIGFGRVEQKGGAYYPHQLTAMYLQGFANYLSSTTTPYVAVGYTRSFNNVLNLGVNAGVGGITGGTFGLLASLRLGAFRIGINSNNIIPLIAPNSGRGTDLGMLLGLAF
jgi:hypothetical protein